MNGHYEEVHKGKEVVGEDPGELPKSTDNTTMRPPEKRQLSMSSYVDRRFTRSEQEATEMTEA